jgi:hypothetical protein
MEGEFVNLFAVSINTIQIDSLREAYYELDK